MKIRFGFVYNSLNSDYYIPDIVGCAKCGEGYEWGSEISECYDPGDLISESIPESPIVICEHCCYLRVHEGDYNFDNCKTYKEFFVKR